MAPIRFALFGSGIFARDAHLPALNALANRFQVVAVYSRSQANATVLAKAVPNPVDAYTDIAQVLAREDIDAVDIVLPIAVQPGVVEAALRAGKHVISEKPVAPDVATGKRLLQTAGELTRASGKAWMVAENYRYEEAFQRAGEIICSGATWRRDNSFAGGYILDGGVHDMAAMRAMMGEVASLSAFVTQVRADLPPADFARIIQDGKALRSTPEEALQDVAILEAMFDSAREGRPVKPARIVAAKA